MPAFTVFYVRLRKLIGVIIHNVRAATSSCDSEKEGKQNRWPRSLDKSKYRGNEGLQSRENLPDGLHDSSGIDEYTLAKCACVRWTYGWWQGGIRVFPGDGLGWQQLDILWERATHLSDHQAI